MKRDNFIGSIIAGLVIISAAFIGYLIWVHPVML